MRRGRPLDGRFWRILSPRWAHDPLSGAGAARHGGRWNPPGAPALYLSREIETAFAEYQQELGTRPGTFVAYDVAGARIAEPDLPMADMLAPWKEVAWVRKQRPATWDVFERLSNKVDGLLVPSVQRTGGVNLVLWRWNTPDGPKVTYHDPDGDLAR